jgi:hypothetical protein
VVSSMFGRKPSPPAPQSVQRRTVAAYHAPSGPSVLPRSPTARNYADGDQGVHCRRVELWKGFHDEDHE